MKNNEPEVYLQTRATTCGISCMMMAIDHFLGMSLTSRTEGNLRKKLKLNRFDLVPAINIAMYLQEQGLDVTVRHDFPYKFWNTLASAPEDLAEQMRKKHLVAKERGVEIKTGEITSSEIVNALDKGLVILGIEIAGGIKHAILLYRINDSIVSYIDPLVGKRAASLDLVLAKARMDVGTWYISISRRMTE